MAIVSHVISFKSHACLSVCLCNYFWTKCENCLICWLACCARTFTYIFEKGLLFIWNSKFIEFRRGGGVYMKLYFKHQTLTVLEKLLHVFFLLPQPIVRLHRILSSPLTPTNFVSSFTDEKSGPSLIISPLLCNRKCCWMLDWHFQPHRTFSLKCFSSPRSQPSPHLCNLISTFALQLNHATMLSLWKTDSQPHVL